MKEKLTLTIERRSISRGKRYSKKNKKSLSSLVQTYMDGLDDSATSKKKTIAESLIGVIRLPKGRTVDDLILQSIKEKHLK